MDALTDDLLRHYTQTLAAGQVAEFKVWAELVREPATSTSFFLCGTFGVVRREAPPRPGGDRRRVCNQVGIATP